MIVYWFIAQVVMGYKSVRFIGGYMKYKKANKRLAKKLIKTHFKKTQDGLYFCPYLVWSDKGCCFFNKDLSSNEVKQLYELSKNKVVYPIVKGWRD